MLFASIVGGMTLSVASCSDDDLSSNQGGSNEALVRFSVKDVQSEAIARGVAMTRGAITPGLANKDLAGQKLTAHSNRNLDVCLIETTVEGINPVKADARTRANIETTIGGDFSSTGIRGVAATSILTTPEWFKAVKTKSNGELYTPIRWSIAQPWARFFAVYPSKDSYSKLTINDMASADNAPSVDFTVEPNVRDQKDFMTACTGEVHYVTQGEHPTTNLDFRHALTAIRFAVGQNLSWNKTIDKVEIRNAIMKSKYKLSNEFNGTGAAWDNTGATRGTATLSGVSVSTSQNPNVTIMGNTGDNFTFYMIPQVLTGNNVHAYIHCTDNTVIDVVLKGEWKAGTTRTYKLSQTNSNWNYVLTSTNPANAVAYDQETTDPYTITSYRENGGTRQAVPWKVIGYDANDDGNFSMGEKPAWLTSLSKESGDGAPYSAETGTASLKKAEIVDMLKERNNGLKNATPLGTATAPYDLSTKGGSVARNTANCYVISAPGHYRIPLVYGNAIENGVTNSRSYISSAPVTMYYGADMILHNFKDHNNQDITDPWIEKTNGGANAGVDGAKIVWADEANLIHLATNPIKQDGGNAFLEFEVKKDDIRSGNAVVAVKKGNIILWSWHLWFAPQSVLNKIEVTNLYNIKYNFTEETLGWKYTKWSSSVYSVPRKVKVRVEQSIANNGSRQFTDITIIQNPGNQRTGYPTLYQAGRKDAIPATNEIKEGTFTENAGNNMSIANGIQNPDKFYTYGSSWYNNPPTGYSYFNLWSAGNTAIGPNDDDVIKTIYDPSPAGFKMPAPNAFTGFARYGSGGSYSVGITMYNVDETYEYTKFLANGGHNFWTNSSRTSSIYFPVFTCRHEDYGLLNADGTWYWSNNPVQSYATERMGAMRISSNSIYVVNSGTYRSLGAAVRPISE